MSYSLDTDIPSATTYVELKCPGARRVSIQVSNGAVNIGFARATSEGGGRAPTYDSPDEAYLPVVGALVRRCDAIRIRARAPISNPVPHVMVTAVGEGDV